MNNNNVRYLLNLFFKYSIYSDFTYDFLSNIV